MLEGVPQRLAGIREAPLTRIALWSVAAGSIVLDLTTLRGSMQDRISVVVGFSLLSLLIYFVIRRLIGRGMVNVRMHAAVVQLAGFLILFLGIVAVFTLARALTERAVAATMAMFHASWALGALDGYRSGLRERLLEGVARGEEDGLAP